MLTNEPGKDRWQLGFKEAVLSEFKFLTAYGLKPVQQDVTLVRYESEDVFLNVYHGRSSFEIGVEIGRLDRSEKYGLDYIVSWAGKQAWEGEGFDRGTMFQVSTREGVQNIVSRVAQLVKNYGDAFLSGRPAFYDDLQKFNDQASVAFEREQMLTRIRKDAEAAWAAKEFSRVAELLEPIRGDLSDVESKRLAYADKQVRSKVTEESAKHG